MGQSDFRKSGIFALVGLGVGLMLLYAALDFQSSQENMALRDYLESSRDMSVFYALIIAIPTVAGLLVGATRVRLQNLRRKVVSLTKEREKLARSRSVSEEKTRELKGLLDQESGYFVDNWDQLVTEKDNLREEAEISSALLQVALDIGTLAGPGDALSMLRAALPAALFADDCLTFEWRPEVKAFVSSDDEGFTLKTRPVPAVSRLAKDHLPLALDDVAQSDLLPDKIKEKLNAVSAIFIPCLSREELSAIAVVVYRKAVHKFTQRDIQIASGIVSQARIVFENAHLYDDVVRSRNELKLLLTKLASTQEDERRRFSRDLHDGVIQNLSGILFSLSFLGNALEPDQESAKSELTQLEEIVNQTIADLREVIYDLRPTILDSLGLVPTLEKHLDRFGRTNGVEIAYNPKIKGRLADTVETGLFRLLQEALNNIRKHAQASKIVVDLKRHKEDVVLTVTDDGEGFDMAEIKQRASQDSGFGLSGMNERVQSLSGSVKIFSKPGEGTKVTVTVPYEAKGA